MPTGTFIRKSLTESHKQNIREALLGRVITKDWREKIRKAHKGKKLSEEHKENIRKSQIGRRHTKETRLRMSIAKRGDKVHLWRGGKTKESKLIRNGIQYRLWRESVFKRDNYTCQFCGKRSGNGKAVILNADHIKPFAHFPELRFELSNGRTLCIECHKGTDTYLHKGL